MSSDAAIPAELEQPRRDELIGKPVLNPRREPPDERGHGGWVALEPALDEAFGDGDEAADEDSEVVY